MQPSSRVAIVVLAAVSVCVDVGFSSADPLMSALSGPASRAAELGAWTTKINRTDAIDPWQTAVRAVDPKPSAAAILGAADQIGAHPYGLHGPVMEGSGHPVTGHGHALSGVASYYGSGGELTAAGEHFDPAAMTAAHPTLPFGTRVRVTRVDNGNSVVVRINDRGPFKPGRVIDLTQGAAENLRMTDVGLTRVRLEVLGRQ